MAGSFGVREDGVNALWFSLFGLRLIGVLCDDDDRRHFDAAAADVRVDDGLGGTY